MLEVTLIRSWIAPNGEIKSSRRNPHLIPDEWRDALPEDASIVEIENEEPEAPKVRMKKGK